MNIKASHIIGAFFVMMAGTFLHFSYDLSFTNDIMALFSAVNESVWEHQKLLFFPTIIYTIVEYFLYGKNYDNFICAKFTSLMKGLIFTITTFYIYTGIIGRSFVVVDILIFIISVISTYKSSYDKINSFKRTSRNRTMASFIGFMLMTALFFTFTFNPPKINIFRDTLTNTYGIEK